MTLLQNISPTRIILQKKLEKDIKQFDKENIKVLEVGAGENSYKKLFKKAKVTTTEIKKHKEIDEKANITKLQYFDNTYNLVLCLSVLEHVFDYRKAINEIFRVTKQKGTVIIQTPFFYPLHDLPNDYWRFSKNALKKILKPYGKTNIEPMPKQNWRIPLSYYCKIRKKNRKR